MSYIKYNVQESEYELYKIIYNLNIVHTPKILDYNKKDKILIMEKIPQLNISDMYGDKFSDVPSYITDEIRNIITVLYENHIEYPDITGYNFIEYGHKLWIIDFEHASYNLNYKKYDPFILQFINGHNNWNPLYE